ncbi:GNAT family N-acetyltransferase [Chryseobacterium sp. OV279]|uniref:GNAT family N-acetyltransferase n=1 Tax=Chryseobacterium sp. OV279 TaxID=1500285 RepID=UPI000932EEB5|nr:GNAT family N-acetyltransferase [Chryseobacterium sp. OV279]
MYVNENFQGKNIGLGLIQAVIGEACERFPGITISLEVTDKNEKAYNLYRKIGFTDVIDTGGKENSGNTQLYLHTANKQTERVNKIKVTDLTLPVNIHGKV